MKGKKKNKKKVGKVILLGMSFLLTIVLTFTITLAWFYDSDWASNTVTMAGTVGIDIRDNTGTILSDKRTGKSGSGNLHFLITTDLAYPGQAIDVSASTFNNGGKSLETGASGGSDCYIRACFTVYTNIGLDDPYTDEKENEIEAEMNSRSIYDFLLGLVATQNEQETDYEWIYYSNASAGYGQYFYPTGTEHSTPQYYYEGTPYTSQDDITNYIQGGAGERGYFYLCYKTSATETIYKKDDTTTTAQEQNKSGILKPLKVGNGAVFLWNSTFIIPWTLTNYSADKDIFVVVEFQAVQTFIPEVESNGTINTNANNQLSAEQCFYFSKSVQTVFNSSGFEKPDLTLRVNRDVNGDHVINDSDVIDFGNDILRNPDFTTGTPVLDSEGKQIKKYAQVWMPTNPNSNTPTMTK